MERKNIVLGNEEDEFALTIMNPMSGAHDGKLFVIFEDSFGDADLKIMTPKAIAKNYNVDLEEITVFMETAKLKTEEKE